MIQPIEHGVSGSVLPAILKNASQQHCATCSLRDMCLPTGMSLPETDRLNKIIVRRRIARGSHLYSINDSFQSLYAVRLGHFKTRQFGLEGDEHITGFHMAGELMGWDAIGTGAHHCDAIALEDSEVCGIPFQKLEPLFGEMPLLLRRVHSLMSREITGRQNIMLLLSNMQAEQRIAAFLVNLSARYADRGYSPLQYLLRMSREDIGNFLGLSIESISRHLNKLKRYGLVHVDGREICILDLASLRRLAAGGVEDAAGRVL